MLLICVVSVHMILVVNGSLPCEVSMVCHREGTTRSGACESTSSSTSSSSSSSSQEGTTMSGWCVIERAPPGVEPVRALVAVVVAHRRTPP